MGYSCPLDLCWAWFLNRKLLTNRSKMKLCPSRLVDRSYLLHLKALVSAETDLNIQIQRSCGVTLRKIQYCHECLVCTHQVLRRKTKRYKWIESTWAGYPKCLFRDKQTNGWNGKAHFWEFSLLGSEFRPASLIRVLIHSH